MTPQVRPFRQRVGGRLYAFTIEPVARRWYAEARYRGALCAAGSGDTPGETLAFVCALLDELTWREAA